MSAASWHVYIVRCADDTLYTGVTIDVARRIQEHNESQKGAKYTRARRPVELVYSESVADRSAAMKRECEIKRLSVSEKQRLLADRAQASISGMSLLSRR